jgi:hypothetical protein
MAYRDVIIADNPVNYWRLGESSGNAIDEMGNFDGSASSRTYGTTGLLVTDANTAACFTGGTGTAQGVNLGSTYTLSGSQISVEAWIDLTFRASTYDCVFIFNNSSSSYLIRLFDYTGSDFNFGVTVNSVSLTLIPSSMPTGPTHIVAVYDGVTREAWLYFNGVEVAYSASAPAFTGSWGTGGQTIIGATPSHYSGTRNALGTIDEVAVYYYPLTAEQVRHHYTVGMAFKSVAGIITDDTGTPCARTVRLYDRATGAFIAETTSDASTGAYDFSTVSSADEVQRIVLDDSDGTLYNDLIDRIIPG